MVKRKLLLHLKTSSNTIRERRLAARNNISLNKSCPSCEISTLQVEGIFSHGNDVWTYCTTCKLNENGNVTHTHSHLTEWINVYNTIVDAYEYYNCV